ncbi:protein THYLAKOID ASSEMBLY 8, chloroplastic-like [Silene latifolia]|uniref:protein THYLAKOID ASSEMBLY 8, chloroplastic-like n=1 Tax=Silene latifolia TaxID=37657 RepID=UPI003D774687
MATLKYQPPHFCIPQIPPLKHNYTTPLITISTLRTRTITCGLRNIGPRKPMWRSRHLSTEAIQAVQALKLAKNPTKLNQVFDTRISRLLKADLLDTLCELQRQNELDLSLKVFEFAKTESWYTPNVSLYYDMIMVLGKNKLIEKAIELFEEMKKEGLKPDTRAYTELIGAYFQVSMVEKAMETYNEMKSSGCIPDKLTLMIMVRNLEKAERDDLSVSVKRDFEEYVDDADEFLEEVEKKYARNPLVVNKM